MAPGRHSSSAWPGMKSEAKAQPAK